MCLCPNKIKNPYYRYSGPLAYMHDCTSQYMYIPCGTCSECIAVKQMYLVQRVQLEAIDSFLFFSTLTYDNKHLPSIGTSQGISIDYADVHHLQLLFDRLEKNNSFGRPFRYLAVSERGSTKARPHFHILWFLPKYQNEDYIDGLSLQKKLYDSIKSFWAENVGTKKHPIYEPRFTFRQKWRDGKLFTNYDTHFVQPSLTKDGISSVAFYVCKYMLKPSDKESRLQRALRLNYDSEEYETLWNIVKSRSIRSASFGLGFKDFNRSKIIEHLKKGINLSRGKSPYPLYFSPDSNKTFPLCPYYRGKGDIFTFKDWHDFHMFDDSRIIDYDKTMTQVSNGISNIKRIRDIVSSKEIGFELDIFFND